MSCRTAAAASVLVLLPRILAEMASALATAKVYGPAAFCAVAAAAADVVDTSRLRT